MSQEVTQNMLSGAAKKINRTSSMLARIAERCDDVHTEICNNFDGTEQTNSMLGFLYEIKETLEVLSECLDHDYVSIRKKLEGEALG